MSGAEVLDVGRDAIWLTIQMCAPVLIVGLIVGVGIGLLQALTQIQEQTLVYAPKIVAIFVSLLIFLPMMGALMSACEGRDRPMESYATAQQVFAGGLIFSRLGAIIMLLPGLGETFIPARVRLAFAVALTFLLFPLLGASAPALPADGAGLGGAVIKELLIGLMI
eukprot:gene32802-55341_t